MAGLTVTKIWDPDEATTPTPSALAAKNIKFATQARSVTGKSTETVKLNKNKDYVYYLARSGPDPVGGIAVLRTGNRVTSIRADTPEIYQGLLEYYKTKVNRTDTSPEERLVYTSKTGAPLPAYAEVIASAPAPAPVSPWDRLTAEQKQPPYFVNERDRYKGVGLNAEGLPIMPNAYMRKLELPPPPFDLGGPREGSVVLGPTPVEEQAPFKVFRKPGGTRRRRNLRKRNRKTRKWTSSGIRKRN